MEQRKINFEDYIKLHESGRNIHELQPLDNETYKIFSMMAKHMADAVQ